MIDWKARYRELEETLELILKKIAADGLESTDNLVIRSVITDEVDGKGEVTIVADGRDLEYAAYYYLKDGNIVKAAYTRSNTFRTPYSKSSFERVKVFVRSRLDKGKVLQKNAYFNG